jgi:nucleotide-binding universal stress UspA family protein
MKGQQSMNPQLDYDHILVATDFSPNSASAVKQAVWLARRTSASIVLAHTIPDFSLSVHWGPVDRQANQQLVHERSDTEMRRMIAELNATSLDITYRTLVGEPFVEITYAVQADGYNLVLAGTRGAGKVEQFFVGSTAKRLIRKCPASVWIVKAEHLVPPKVVLAATDFSDISLKAVRNGLKIAQQASAEFHLLHVVDSKDVPDDIISHIPAGSSLRQEISDEANRRLADFLTSAGVDRTQVQVHLSWGTPWQEIRRITRHQAVDLIVIGTVGRNGIKGLFLGNTAEKVLDTCDCSILTVKPDDFVSPIEPQKEE